METQLLEIDLTAADDEELNSIFRCAHSVKGGAATFGFADLAELTHQMETLLDKLRRHELTPTTAMVDVLLQWGDALRAQLARHQGAGGEPVDTADVQASIRAMSSGQAPAATAPIEKAIVRDAAEQMAGEALAPKSTTTATATAPARKLDVRVGPLKEPAQANELFALFNKITDLGTIEAIDCGQPSDGIRRFRVVTTSTDADLLDLFTFHVARDEVMLLPVTAGCGFHAGAPGAPAEVPLADRDPGYGFFDDAPGAPGSVATTPNVDTPAASADAANASVNTARAPARNEKAPTAALESTTLRVSVEKVDQLINLVGELVITQAMLAQNSKQIDTALYQQFVAGLADLDRNTRDLQESVMSIRMIPMSTVFSRFPHMLRDLAAKLGKKVEFVTKGEATELDKGLVEKKPTR